MTNVQLYLAVALPIITNAAMFTLLFLYTTSQIAGINSQMAGLREDIRELRSDMKLLTGKVYELMGHKD